MNLDNAIFLCANTARSKAYAQALEHSGLQVGKVVFFAEKDSIIWGKAQEGSYPPAADLPGGIFCHDLSVPLLDTCSRITSEVIELATNNINDEIVINVLVQEQPQLVIFSGYGGQIVGRTVLGVGGGFLHLHSGWLPDYRGSTTTYYSLLAENKCGVTAFLLDAEIDTGEIILRRYYPPPPCGVDIDYIYDSAIRADLLIRVLGKWQSDRFADTVPQDKNEGTTYYVIHPVLKHLALLALKQG